MTLELIELKATSPSKNKPPLLFIHGSFCSAPIWRHRFMPFFAEQGYDCYALSLRGHGKSEGDFQLHFYGLNDYVDDIRSVIDQLPEAPILVGHSLGGMVVQKYIEDHVCAGVILLNSLPPSGAFSSMIHMMAQSPELYWALNTSMMFGADLMNFDALKQMLVSEETHPASMAELHCLFQPESMRALTDVTFLDVPRKQAIEGFPICVMGGDCDVMIPVTALKETATFHGADLEIIPGAPHAVMLDHNWKMVAERMRSWILRSI